MRFIFCITYLKCSSFSQTAGDWFNNMFRRISTNGGFQKCPVSNLILKSPSRLPNVESSSFALILLLLAQKSSLLSLSFILYSPVLILLLWTLSHCLYLSNLTTLIDAKSLKSASHPSKIYHIENYKISHKNTTFCPAKFKVPRNVYRIRYSSAHVQFEPSVVITGNVFFFLFIIFHNTLNSRIKLT